jgi:hypothetical protein
MQRFDSIQGLPARKRPGVVPLSVLPRQWPEFPRDSRWGRLGQRTHWWDARCWYDPAGVDYEIRRFIISSAGTVRSKCPGWYEASAADSANPLFVSALLKASMTGKLLVERRRVRAQLDSAGGIAPSSDWLAMQRVRFALLDGDTSGAAGIVRDCAASTWACAALSGYVLSLQGSVVPAEAAFRTAAASTDGKVR